MESRGRESNHLLAGKRVFLGAGIPEDDWTGELPWQRHEIVQAVMATTRATLQAGGELVFGGHPLITPIIFSIASQTLTDEVGAVRVLLFQSTYFADALPSRVWDFRRAAWALVRDIPGVEPSPDGFDESVSRMRTAMLSPELPLSAALFIGGKPGVRDEYMRVRELFGTIPCYPIRRPGGIAADLSPANVTRELARELSRSAAYGHLARVIVRDIAQRAPYFGN